MIEDSESGIQAACDAGIKAVGIGSKTTLKKAELVLENTRLLKLKTLTKLF